MFDLKKSLRYEKKETRTGSPRPLRATPLAKGGWGDEENGDRKQERCNMFDLKENLRDE